MKQYIVELTRIIGKGNDMINFFNNRGYEVVWEDREVMPKTIIVETPHEYIEDLSSLKYVLDVKEVRIGTVFKEAGFEVVDGSGAVIFTDYESTNKLLDRWKEMQSYFERNDKKEE